MRTAILVGLSLSFVGCANGTVDRDSGRLTRIDTGLSLVDAGPATLDSGGDAHLAMADAYSVEDAFSEVDAFAATDAFTPMADAFTPTPDAFVPADAFVPVDAYTAPDAYSPSGCVTPPASGAIALTGTTVGAPSAPRPDPTFFEDCPSDLASSVPFRSHVICANTVSATYEIRVSGSIPDSFLVLYEGLSIPSDRRECALLDDDSAGAGQAMITVDVMAGTPFTAMVTGFNPSDVGPYTLTIRRL